MDYTDTELALRLAPPRVVYRDWYLKGYSDGYRARRPAFLLGTARAQYKKGYAEGLAAARNDFAEAIRDC